MPTIVGRSAAEAERQRSVPRRVAEYSKSLMPRWFIPFLALTVFVIVVFLFVRVLLRRKAVTQPACGNCGYFVRGITTFTCPECGQDLREAGIVTPTSHAKGWSSDPLLRAALWTLLLPIPATILTVAAYESPLTPRVLGITLDRTIIGETEPFRDTVQLQQNASAYYWPLVQQPPTTTEQHLLMYISRRGATLAVHLPSNTCTLHGTSSVSLGKFNREAVIEWMRRAGYDADEDARLAAVAQALVEAVNDTPNRTPQVTYFGTDVGGKALVAAQPVVARSSAAPPDWAWLPYIGFWLLVWVVGLIVIFRRRGGASGGGRRA